MMSVKSVKLNMKHSDLCSIQLLDADGATIEESDDGMPFVGILGGDYTKLTIDNETGTIIGWKPIESLSD